LPPGRERARANFRYFVSKIISNLRRIKLKAVKLACEKYEGHNKTSTLDDYLVAIPSSLSEIEALLQKLMKKIMQKAKSSFRSLIEGLIKRAGHLFDCELKEVEQ
jgi:hypothetical protein